MKAGIYNGVGKVEVMEIAKPECTDGAIIVKNIRSGICGTDLHAYTLEGEGVGILPGNQFGHEMAGVIYESEADGFRPGTSVFINPCTFREPTDEMSILMCCDMAGAFSQYVRVDKPQWEYNVFRLPDDLPWDVAALIEPISVALNTSMQSEKRSEGGDIRRRHNRSVRAGMSEISGNRRCYRYCKESSSLRQSH